MVQLKANLTKESTYSEGDNKRAYDPVQYSPLPNEAGQTAQNKVIVSLVAPARWKMFNPTEQDIEKFGLSSTHVFGNDLEWGSLYFQLPSHRVVNFQYLNGNTGFAHSLCPLALNKYLIEGLELPPLFDTPVRCAYCEEKDRLWDVHNDAWKSLGIDKKGLSKDGYFAAMKEHDILQKTRDAAWAMTAKEKNVISVFDHDKHTQKRKLDEGQKNVTWQSWYAPYDIYKGLKELHTGLSEASMPPFFDVENPAGVHILMMNKDTTGWTQNSKLKTAYGVQNLGERYTYSPEWLEYLKNDANYADPSSFIHMLSYEEQVFYLSQANEKQSFNRERKTTVDVGGAQPVPPAQMAPPTEVPAPAQTPPASESAPAQTPPPAAMPGPEPTATAAPAPTPAPAPAVPTTATIAGVPAAAVVPIPQPVSAATAVVPVPQPVSAAPIPVLPTAPATPAVPPASPAPVVGGAPIPDREPPVGGPPPGRVNWD